MLELSNFIKLSMPLKMVIILILKNSAYQDGGSSYLEALHCVLEQDTILCLELVQSRKTHPDMTEKLLTWM